LQARDNQSKVTPFGQFLMVAHPEGGAGEMVKCAAECNVMEFLNGLVGTMSKNFLSKMLDWYMQSTRQKCSPRLS
jgi:hypothetical protein